MSAPTVCAVVPAADRAVEAALAAQSAGIDAVVRDVDVLGCGVRRALEGPADWIWVMDGSAIPARDALRRLLGALTAPVPAAPMLLASKVIAPDGSLAEGHAPWLRRGATELAMELAPHHMLPIRASRAGSLMLLREAAGAGRGPAVELGMAGAGLEWTARLLRRAVGILVTDSVAFARTAGPPSVQTLSSDPYDDLQAGVAMVCGEGWYAKERLWLGAEVAQRAASSLRGRRASPLHLARAAGRGWRGRR
jgi:hypothetical protein